MFCGHRGSVVHAPCDWSMFLFSLNTLYLKTLKVFILLSAHFIKGKDMSELCLLEGERLILAVFPTRASSLAAWLTLSIDRQSFVE